jgi:2-polyprenyl-3-methyl-5-hydroxy-6-metoxy-1,4-benzoquinol methylase
MDDAAIDEMAAFEDHHWWFVGKRLLVSALVGDRLDRPGLRILDVGCGTGGVLANLARHGSAIGVDRSVQALRHTARRGVAGVACADMDKLPFGPARFDLVMMLDVIEHFADDRAVVAAARRVLRPSGTLLVSVPAFQALFSEHDVTLQHFRRYTARQLRTVLEAGGFVVRRLTYTNVVALPPAALVRGLLPRLGIRRPAGTDFREHAPWVNRALIGVYRAEAAALRARVRMPFGLSVAAVAELPAA